MARLFIADCNKKGMAKNDIPTVSMYIDIVNSNFNLGFQKPKKDRCQFCLFMTNSGNSRALKEQYKAKYAAHLINWHKARDLKESDKIDGERKPGVVTTTFDLEKQLDLPKTDSGPAYYLSPMHVLNLTFFNCNKRLGTCYIWHEGVGKKGSSEVCSCMYMYLQKQVMAGATDIRNYSDNCAGQNKNRYLFALYVYFAIKHGVSITHRYLEAGHTQMEADSIHGRIEKSTDGEEIYDFKGWIDAIEAAKEMLPKYEVVTVKNQQMISFRGLVEKQNWRKDTRGEVVAWKKVREVHVTGSDNGLVKIRYAFDGEVITLNTRKVGHPINMHTYVPPRAYEGMVPIRPNTRESLQTMCKDFIIPEQKQAFVRGVLAGTYPDEDDPSEPEFDSDDDLCESDVLMEKQEEENLTANPATGHAPGTHEVGSGQEDDSEQEDEPDQEIESDQEDVFE